MSTGGGALLIERYQAYAEANGIPVLLGHRAERVVLNDAGAVIGVEVSASADDATPAPSVVKTFRARKGVVFVSGGFGKNPDLMHQLMPAPYYAGCGAPTNEGDFLRIGAALGAKLGNLHNVYCDEGIFEQAVASRMAITASGSTRAPRCSS